MAKNQQLLLPFSYVRNRGLLSNHWFEKRLEREPEWTSCRQRALDVLDDIAVIWKRERNRVELYETEAPLEQAFIQPVFEALGWKLIYQPFLEGRRPDYALFLDDAAKDAALSVERKSPEFWRPVNLVADAKAWHVPLNRPSVVNNQREYPPQQIEWYLERSRRDFGFLTNGQLWRLVPREHSPQQRRFQTYLECDLAKLLADWSAARSITEQDLLREEFLRFYLFFSPAGFTQVEHLKPLIQRAIAGSSEYRVGVGEGLKERAFEALSLCIEGLLNLPGNELYPATDRECCRAESFILLYRLLFIMYAEDRGLLPYRKDRNYTLNRSLARHRDDIAGRLQKIAHDEEDDYSRETVGIWEDVQSLCDMVNSGHMRYGVPEFNGGLFDPDAHPFLEQKRISDWYMARIIDQLGRAQDPVNPQDGLFRVDYRDLAIQHLGGVYEGLLELQPQIAAENMVVIEKQSQGRVVQDYLTESQPVPAGWQLTDRRYLTGAVYLKTQKGERRASGSYYTPDHIVAYIVEQTLGPLCTSISARLESEVAALTGQLASAQGDARAELDSRIATLKASFDDEILKLKVLDPAMGSGHFLLRACQRLAEEIATHPFTGDAALGEMLAGESAVSVWKRRVVESCLYGVDLNPLAVELAKLALWLETVAGDEPLSFLNHHLHFGNSLVGGKIALLGSLPDETQLHSERYREQIEAKLPVLLEPLARIAEISSATAAQVKEKDRIYREFERAREPFRLIGDLWCSAFCAGVELTSEQYQQAIDDIERPRKFAETVAKPWFKTAIEAANREFGRCFHWEVEYPEVFFVGAKRRENAGFDVIIGNPPWGDIGTTGAIARIGGFGAVTSDMAEYFVCKVASLIRTNGRIGQVLPDTILSPSKVKIRREMLSSSKTEGMLNIGPDWFSSDVRMSTVLWSAIGADSTAENDYRFATCILPIKTRRETQRGTASLADVIEASIRTTSALTCLDDPECAIPLFGDREAAALMDRVLRNAPTISEICNHARGVELNRAGDVIRCPHCGRWDAPARDTRKKKCAHCDKVYRADEGVESRRLVSEIVQRGSEWRPYIDGDEVKRYSRPKYEWIDISADGVNYKPEETYASPKVFIRQAGIGINALLDTSKSAYCPQSIYLYSVKPEIAVTGFDNAVFLSLLCSRLFHLQVFMAFGEIDSSRAFSKLTHTRLSRLRTVSVDAIKRHPKMTSRIKTHVQVLAEEGIQGREEHDWQIEACWSRIFDLRSQDIESVVRNFAHVHESEVIQTLFPGGVESREEFWIERWMEAMRTAHE